MLWRPSRLESCWRKACSVAIGHLAALVAEQQNVVALRLSRPEAVYGPGLEPALGHDLIEHGAGILVERARGLAYLGVIENGGELAGELPGAEERGPVDVVD